MEGQGKNSIALQASTAMMRNADPKYFAWGDNDNDIDDEEVSLSPSMMSTNDEDEYGGNGGWGRSKFRVRQILVVERVNTTRGKLCCKRNVVEEVYDTREVRVDSDGNEISDAESNARKCEYTETRKPDAVGEARRREEHRMTIQDKRRCRRREKEGRQAV
jgi:hypothetical protein